MRSCKKYLEYIVNEIHTTIVATVNENGLPVTCVIDMMYCDENGLYFLTAKGKNFYHRLKDKEYQIIAFLNIPSYKLLQVPLPML